jgi:hypothetical protein
MKPGTLAIVVSSTPAVVLQAEWDFANVLCELKEGDNVIVVDSTKRMFIVLTPHGLGFMFHARLKDALEPWL